MKIGLQFLTARIEFENEEVERLLKGEFHLPSTLKYLCLKISSDEKEVECVVSLLKNLNNLVVLELDNCSQIVPILPHFPPSLQVFKFGGEVSSNDLQGFSHHGLVFYISIFYLFFIFYFFSNFFFK